MRILLIATGPIFNATSDNITNGTTVVTDVADCTGSSPLLCSGTLQFTTTLSNDRVFYEVGAQTFGGGTGTISNVNVTGPLSSSFLITKKYCGSAACNLSITTDAGSAYGVYGYSTPTFTAMGIK